VGPQGDHARDQISGEHAAGLAGRMAQAWEELDADLALELFTDDVVYWASPFHAPHRGRAAVREHLQAQMQGWAEVRVWSGEPMRAGGWVAVERWMSVEHLGVPATIAGVSLLRLAADGRCCEVRDYWLESAPRLVPYLGWGVFTPTPTPSS
jgi:hypothetical protein